MDRFQFGSLESVQDSIKMDDCGDVGWIFVLVIGLHQDHPLFVPLSSKNVQFLNVNTNKKLNKWSLFFGLYYLGNRHDYNHGNMARFYCVDILSSINKSKQALDLLI